MTWTEHTIAEQIESIKDIGSAGANLLKKLLNVDPTKRPKSMRHVLHHQFFVSRHRKEADSDFMVKVKQERLTPLDDAGEIIEEM